MRRAAPFRGHAGRARWLLWAAVCLLAGCAGHFREFDGVRGFRGSIMGNSVEASYTETAPVSWARIEAHVRTGCGRLLGVSPVAVRLEGAVRIQSRQQVAVLSSPPSADAFIRARPRDDRSSVFLVDRDESTVPSLVTVRTLRARCFADAAGAGP